MGKEELPSFGRQRETRLLWQEVAVCAAGAGPALGRGHQRKPRAMNGRSVPQGPAPAIVVRETER
jgi:hypothetical protein